MTGPFVAPPHTVQNVKRSIANVENIKDHTVTSLFLTPHSQSPMGDACKVTILGRTGPGSTPQKPLALVAKMLDSKRSALESEGRGGLASAAAFDPEQPSLGRIWDDSVPPPHSLASCISRVERTPALAHADIFADISCKTPLKEGRISIFRTDYPGLSPKKPMAIVQMPIERSIPDGKYLIKN